MGRDGVKNQLLSVGVLWLLACYFFIAPFCQDFLHGVWDGFWATFMPSYQRARDASKRAEYHKEFNELMTEHQAAPASRERGWVTALPDSARKEALRRNYVVYDKERAQFREKRLEELRQAEAEATRVRVDSFNAQE